MLGFYVCYVKDAEQDEEIFVVKVESPVLYRESQPISSLIDIRQNISLAVSSEGVVKLAAIGCPPLRVFVSLSACYFIIGCSV